MNYKTSLILAFILLIIYLAPPAGVALLVIWFLGYVLNYIGITRGE